MIKKIALTVGLLATAIAPAFAADLPLKARAVAPVMAPSFSWSGCYLGGFVGGATSERDARATDVK